MLTIIVSIHVHVSDMFSWVARLDTFFLHWDLAVLLSYCSKLKMKHSDCNAGCRIARVFLIRRSVTRSQIESVKSKSQEASSSCLFPPWDLTRITALSSSRWQIDRSSGFPIPRRDLFLRRLSAKRTDQDNKVKLSAVLRMKEISNISSFVQWRRLRG